MVHVVSMDEVPTMLGSVSFQSNDVSGAQNSLPRDGWNNRREQWEHKQDVSMVAQANTFATERQMLLLQLTCSCSAQRDKTDKPAAQ